ncbi:LuxR family transcriptional regulator [Mycobacterium sp. 852013-50091_SCH5140682]|uniref:helix-turn-helix transcriptional regulator n=1 Tax=Mycobacterium sp. 852013-50091_SCH5140682 TaxID=1834109 RepID=UPI0007EA1D2F|nr:LuxR family transcriptional regulator [Mycobacterium sp. 852013-50091_SCH5140682]OBC07492.1 LuxR family transcriptional regulator [Mycobacterium sp. 852013-50091_SCH5140682]
MRRTRRLYGRDAECAALDELLADVRTGRSRALVLRGEPGAGKTALLAYLHNRRADTRMLRVTCVESDMELPYAGLQHLCAPLLDRLDSLPQPQRDAVSVAFGLAAGPPPDAFLVGLAVLSLLSEVAGTQPLLCLADDAQWIDQASLQALTFVARRLSAGPVGVIFAARTTSGRDTALTELPELVVGGLTTEHAGQLLDSLVPGRLDRRVRDQIVAETRGLPLGLLESVRNRTAAQLAGGFGDPGHPGPQLQLELTYAHRIAALPLPTRQLLLAAAADPVGDPLLLMRAAQRLGIPASALAPAEREGLIELTGRVLFDHPLVRSAAYRSADLAERRAIHRVLAEVTDADVDPDRRAWHSAYATTGPDDAVAAELEAAAGRAQQRGGVAAAAALLQRATALSRDPARRGARALAAARAKSDAAAPGEAEELLGIAELGPLTDLDRARATHLRARLLVARGTFQGPPVAELIDAARQLANLNDPAAGPTYLEALAAAMHAGRLGDPAAVHATAQSAQAVTAPTPEPPHPAYLLVSGISRRMGTDDGTGHTELRAGVALLDTLLHTEPHRIRWPGAAFPIAQESAVHEIWDDEAWHRLATRSVQLTRDTAALAILPRALGYRAGAHVQAGEFAAAAMLLDEADSLSAAAGHPPMTDHSLILAAWRGHPAEANRLIQAAAERATARGEGRLLGLTAYAGAVLHNGLGSYDQAYAAAREACEYQDLGLFGWSLTEFVESASRCGEPDAAKRALRQLEQSTLPSGTDWALGTLAGARALLADDQLAEELYAEAIERLDRTRIVVQQARARLRYGEWLRRMNRRADARTHLGAAHTMFTHMGAQAFAERARRELVATGEKTRRRPAGGGDRLTAQEAQIAGLAAAGLTNQEIGAQMFISTHTVEWHLRKVFVKLNITSRRQLRGTSWVV